MELWQRQSETEVGPLGWRGCLLEVRGIDLQSENAVTDDEKDLGLAPQAELEQVG